MEKYNLSDAIMEYFATRKKMVFGRLTDVYTYLDCLLILVAKILIGGQEIGEANSDDIGLWCYIYWCS